MCNAATMHSRQMYQICFIRTVQMYYWLSYHKKENVELSGSSETIIRFLAHCD